MNESQLMDAIRLALGAEPGLVLFRNNIGMAWMRDGKPVRFGVGGPGASDLVGVYRGRAVFVEIKTPVGRLSPEQRTFEQLCARVGAIYVVLRSVEDAQAWLATLRASIGAAA